VFAGGRVDFGDGLRELQSWLEVLMNQVFLVIKSCSKKAEFVPIPVSFVTG